MKAALENVAKFIENGVIFSSEFASKFLKNYSIAENFMILLATAAL